MANWRRTVGAPLRVALLGGLLAVAAVPLLSGPAGATATKTTTTTVTGTPAAVTGESLVFTATVTHNALVPTGTVTFSITGSDTSTWSCDGGSNTITLAANSGGSGAVAQCSISAGLNASASPYTVQADYSGDDTFLPSTGTLSKTVHLGATSTMVTAGSNPSVSGQTVSFSATVAPKSPAIGVPTGSATFTISGSDGSSPSCDGGNTIPLTGDVATCNLSLGLQAQGSQYTVSATYSGDTDFAQSTGSVMQKVAKATATVGVTSSSSTVVSGQPVTFTATVTSVAAPGMGTPSGNMVFSVVGSNGTTVNCSGGNTQPISGTSAQCDFPSGLSGKPLSYTVSATLSDPNLKSPIAGSLVQQVGQAKTSTVITGLPGSLVASQGFTFHVTVNVKSPGSGAPTGLVEWAACTTSTSICNGGGTVQLPTPTSTDIGNNQNKVTISDGGLPPGFYQVTATYVGNGNFVGGTSDPGFVQVTKAITSSTLVLTQNPAPNGARVSVRDGIVTDSRSSNAYGAPTGTVTYTITGASSDTLTCDGGSNDISISTGQHDQGLAHCVIDAGQLSSADSPYKIEADYSGDSHYKASTATDTLIVNP